MKKHLKGIAVGLVLSLAALVAGTWLLIASLGTGENLYEGRPSNYWIAQVNSRDPATSNAACAVLNREIIPQLTETMLRDTNDSTLRLALVDKLNDLPGVSIRFIPARNRRKGATSTLGYFGPAAQAAVPALIQALTGADDAVRPKAAAALGKIHGQPEVVVPLLVKYLDDEDMNEAAAVGLADYGARAKAAVPKLMQLSEKRDNPGLQTLAGRALKQIDPQAAVPPAVK
jgi:HEAT repeat protein